MEETNVNVENVEVEGGATETKEENVEVKAKEEKLFTQDDLNRILDKKFAQWKKKEEEAKKEAEKLATMSAEEKAKHEFEKEKQEFEALKRSFENERLLNETTKQLASENLPIEFAEMLKGVDAETTFANIKVFKEKFNSALEKAVTDRLKGQPPKVATVANGTGVTKETLKNMNIIQQMKFKQENPDLYEELTK